MTIEAQYTVGEHDIVILSAQQSNGLETWLTENGYRIPAGASAVLASYLKQNMRFFVAKVNVTEHAALGFSYLRPLQIAHESPKFMLPIRLGMANANGAQELFVYALTRNGPRRDHQLPDRAAAVRHGASGNLKDKGEFGRFYRAMFARQVENEGGRVLFLGTRGTCAGAIRARPIRSRPTNCATLASSGPTGEPATGCLPHAAPRALRQRALPRGSRLSGNGRPFELPGTLRAAASVDGEGLVQWSDDVCAKPRAAAQ